MTDSRTGVPDGAGEGLETASVRTVFFDFDGTLVFHSPDSFDIISHFCAQIGQPLSAEAAREGRRMRHQYFVDPVIREELDGLSRDRFYQHFNRYLLEALCIEGDLEQLALDLTNHYSDVTLTYECPEAGCRTLSELRNRGYNLGLITNRENVERFRELLDRLSLGSYFDLVLASGEVGIRKPEAGIFHAALDRAGAEAERSIYVGDNYWADVVGARNAEMTPVLYDPHGLFPEADCRILLSIDELLAWLP
ncbi:MAG: HAD family hydrolase [Anaerolineae bacterium]|nr:HAD family hydrolase [Anaerolineae bacterium]